MTLFADIIITIIAGLLLGFILKYFYSKWEYEKKFKDPERILRRIEEEKKIFILDGKEYDLEKEIKQQVKNNPKEKKESITKKLSVILNKVKNAKSKVKSKS